MESTARENDVYDAPTLRPIGKAARNLLRAHGHTCFYRDPFSCEACHPPTPPKDLTDEVVRHVLRARGHTCLREDSCEWCRDPWTCTGTPAPSLKRQVPSFPPGTEMFVFEPDRGAAGLEEWLREAGHPCARVDFDAPWEVTCCGRATCRYD